MMDEFTLKWFALYYPILGLLLLAGGIGLITKADAIIQYLRSRAKTNKPPKALRTILKYFFLFTLSCLVLSFFPFSWPELLFSVWSLVMVYILGIQLVRWPQTRQSIKDHPEKVHKMITMTGVITLALSPVMFLLCYLVIQRL